MSLKNFKIDQLSTDKITLKIGDLVTTGNLGYVGKVKKFDILSFTDDNNVEVLLGVVTAECIKQGVLDHTGDIKFLITNESIKILSNEN